MLVTEGIPSIFGSALAVQHSNNGELLLKTIIAGKSQVYDLLDLKLAVFVCCVNSSIFLFLGILSNIGPEGLNSAAGTVLSSVISLMSCVLELEALVTLKKATIIIEELSSTTVSCSQVHIICTSKVIYVSKPYMNHILLKMLN